MLVYASRPGQLGNCLLYSSHLIFYAVEQGDTVFLPLLLDLDYAKHFKGPRLGTIPRYPAPLTHKVSALGELRRKLIYRAIKMFAKVVGRLKLNNPLFQTFFATYASGVVDLSRPEVQSRVKQSRATFLVGETFRYMKGSPYETHLARIREYFEPVDDTQRSVAGYLEKFADIGEVIVVAVHMRRGDYRQWSGGKFFYSDEVYLEKMLQFQAEFPSKTIRFILFSDDPIKLAFFEEAGLEVHPAIGGVFEDLHLMSKCNYIMGPQSTFSRWASYYGSVPLLIIREAAQPVKREQFVVNAEP
jgi:glycosyl transferase family 11